MSNHPLDEVAAEFGIDLTEPAPVPQVFIQYKNTDICLDMYCECGISSHYDGYFAGHLRCPGCQRAWALEHMVPMHPSIAPNSVIQMAEAD